MMSEPFKYRVSVIVPVYCAQAYLRDCLESLVWQTIPGREMEVLMIDDGSSDSSFDIMREYARRFPNFRALQKENGGVSAARNYGISHAQGKYLMFLDSDDMLASDTVKSVADFFDAHEEEVDLVTYRIVLIRGDERRRLHFRYDILTESGVYDLLQPENAYICQTTVNVCVKNFGVRNVLFDTSLNDHEDQKYNTQILQPKMKLGFCAEGEYRYIQHAESVSHTHLPSDYRYEESLQCWESLFDDYAPDEVPLYLQALFVNNLKRKLDINVLFPDPADTERYRECRERQVALLDRVEDSVILNLPRLSPYLSHYFISLKSGNEIHLAQRGGAFVLLNHGQPLSDDAFSEICLERFRLEKDFLSLTASVRSPFFIFFDEPPMLLLKVNGSQEEKTPLPVTFSCRSYTGPHTLTGRSWQFDLNLDLRGVNSFQITVLPDGQAEMPTRWVIHRNFCFLHLDDRHDATIIENRFLLHDNGVFHLTPVSFKQLLRRRLRFWRHPRTWLLRQLYLLPHRGIVWLYLDAPGVSNGPAYRQFVHDLKTSDGIERFYVIRSDRYRRRTSQYSKDLQEHLLSFASLRHKFLYMHAERIITSAEKWEQSLPFSDQSYRRYHELCPQYEFVLLPESKEAAAELSPLQNPDLLRFDRILSPVPSTGAFADTLHTEMLPADCTDLYSLIYSLLIKKETNDGKDGV